MEHKEVVVELNVYRDTRLGFTPDMTFRAVGMTMGEAAVERQDALEKAARFSTATTSPPIMLIRQPDNKFDAGAIEVRVGVDVANNQGKQVWLFKPIGYVPKNMSIVVRNKLGEVIPKEYPLYKVMDMLSAGTAPGSLKVGVDFIVKAPGTDSYGVQIGIRHEVLPPVPEVKKDSWVS